MTTAKPDFWRSSGFHLLQPDARGWLRVTPDFLRAYLARPEMRPVEESCRAEHALHGALLDNPVRPVGEADVSALADEDVQHNYRVVLRFRDLLIEHGTLEAAYLAIVTSGRGDVPVLFVEQLVHAILRNVLSGCTDPMRLRAAELFFRQQNVSLDSGRVMLADEEVVEMYAQTGGMGGLGQLLVESMTPMRQVELDVLDDDNKSLYWDRSDRFDTVIDFRFTQPGVDAFARVMEAWIAHFLEVRTRIQPMQAIHDEHWSWHIGLDAGATEILNALYEGEDVGPDDLQRILGLFRMEIRDDRAVVASMRGKPIYLGLAMTPDGKLRMKPQNLLTNLPFSEGA
ncbi:DUF6352 family protein [Microbaculum marinisediminis]|uniref:DUF6352 family protein n=1 Tax=Microbaculum marinisediminis TaxID=2931392 RepID=A0AAW5QXK9_9HYPH|nr:DUF6352 family protein [Microbaculum sp. A6E488]MCT8971089.1 DUF6352 family protein [Microbaculum sp. A6E488]